MVREHAFTVKEEITIADIDYMVQKANKLGIKKRKIYNVFLEKDSEGTHYYFEVTELSANRLSS